MTDSQPPVAQPNRLAVTPRPPPERIRLVTAAAPSLDDVEVGKVTITRTALETVPDVELIEVGTWEASTGEVTFTTDDLASAVAAQQDPAVRPPVVKLGHMDPRFNGRYLSDLLAVTARELGINSETTDRLVKAMPFHADGQPALGRVVNMRLSQDGMVLVGDLFALPAWLAEIVPVAYPTRSAEATFRWEPDGLWGYESPSGRTHRFVVTGLALLGETLPAVSSLSDVRGLFFSDSTSASGA